MPTWGRHARRGLGLALASLALAAGVRAAAPPPGLRAEAAHPDSTRAAAEAAERAGEWEAAFSLYCRLLLTDRSPDSRGKVSAALRHAQQVRRLLDPAFRRFVERLALSDALDLYAEVFGKLPTLFAERDKATPAHLWQHGIEEFDRALASPGFQSAYLAGDAPERVAAFRTSLRVFWAKRPVASGRGARRSSGTSRPPRPRRSRSASLPPSPSSSCAAPAPASTTTRFSSPPTRPAARAARRPCSRTYSLTAFTCRSATAA